MRHLADKPLSLLLFIDVQERGQRILSVSGKFGVALADVDEQGAIGPKMLAADIDRNPLNWFAASGNKLEIFPDIHVLDLSEMELLPSDFVRVLRDHGLHDTRSLLDYVMGSLKGYVSCEAPEYSVSREGERFIFSKTAKAPAKSPASSKTRRNIQVWI